MSNDRRPPVGPDMSGTALAQGDLAVNLFMVLLVTLSMLTVAEVSSSSAGYLTPYERSEVSETVGAPPLGWQPVLPIYPKLVVRDRQVYLIDLTALAISFAQEQPLYLGPDRRDTSRMREGDLDPSSHMVYLRMYEGAAFPGALVAATVPLAAIDAEEGTAFFGRLSNVPKVDLFVFPEEMERLAPLVDAIHHRSIGVRIIVMERQDVFGFVYSGGDFGLERTFK